MAIVISIINALSEKKNENSDTGNDHYLPAVATISYHNNFI
jgi:hypothetical protein